MIASLLETCKLNGVDPLAWSTDGLIVMANMWWEPLTFRVERPGPWKVELASAPPRRRGRSITIAPRSVVVLSG